MSKKTTILVVVITALIAGGGVYLWQTNKLPKSLPSLTQETKGIDLTSETTSLGEWEDLIKYNCELSSGTFSDGRCKCPVEVEIAETGGMAYDKHTGYCQSAHGGPGGLAFYASIGLPWGDYSFWHDIVGNNCTKSGGLWGNANCTCPDGKTYDRSTGTCK